jgi:hypothetical protein
MQMNKIAHYLPHYDTSKDKLTALLVEFGIYNQVVLFSFYETLKEQLEGTPLSEDGEQIVNQINLHQGRVISEQFLSHIRDQFSIYSSVDFLELNSKIFVLIFDFLREQIPTKEFKDHMSNFDLVSAYNKGKLNELLKPVVESIIAFFQLSSLTMKHSDAYNNLLKNKENSFIKIINESITEEQARNILANIQVPEVPKDQFLIKIR